MKKLILFFCAMSIVIVTYAQKYPEPEFTHEVVYLKKDSIHSLIRLEKSSSKMENKVKAGGFGGSESAYQLEGERSSIRLASNSLSFVYSKGTTSAKSSVYMDSMMRANGMDPAMMQNMGSMNDPSKTINLYKAETKNGLRKIYIMKAPGVISFSKKSGSSDKYSFSVKKVREGYWELVIDKSLPKGEYVFAMMANMDMNGGIELFAFGVD